MEDLIIFMITFVIVFLVYLALYFIRRKRGTLYKTKDVQLLCARYGLKKKDIDVNRVCLITSLINSLIISITGTVCTSLDLGVIWQLAIGFVMLVGLIYVIYTLLGRFLIRKVRMKNEHK